MYQIQSEERLPPHLAVLIIVVLSILAYAVFIETGIQVCKFLTWL